MCIKKAANKVGDVFDTLLYYAVDTPTNAIVSTTKTLYHAVDSTSRAARKSERKHRIDVRRLAKAQEKALEDARVQEMVQNMLRNKAEAERAKLEAEQDEAVVRERVQRAKVDAT